MHCTRVRTRAPSAAPVRAGVARLGVEHHVAVQHGGEARAQQRQQRLRVRGGRRARRPAQGQRGHAHRGEARLRRHDARVCGRMRVCVCVCVCVCV